MYNVEYDIDELKLNDGDVIFISQYSGFSDTWYTYFYIVEYLNFDINILCVSDGIKTKSPIKNIDILLKNTIINSTYCSNKYEKMTDILDDEYIINRIEQKFLIDNLEQNITNLYEDISYINDDIEKLKIMKQNAIKQSMINGKI